MVRFFLKVRYSSFQSPLDISTIPVCSFTSAKLRNFIYSLSTKNACNYHHVEIREKRKRKNQLPVNYSFERFELLSDCVED